MCLLLVRIRIQEQGVVPISLWERPEYHKQIKGVWGMPRLSEAMKDVISCDKSRGSAHMN